MLMRKVLASGIIRLVFTALLFSGFAWSDGPGVFVSSKANADFVLSADPESAAWKAAPKVIAVTDPFGKPLPKARTEIRSRWTKDHLYFLFISNYESLYLTPNPVTAKDTWGLWDYDVVEVFIGHDLKNIHLYKEIEVSPQGEFIDLDVDRHRKGKEVDALWNSNLHLKTRVDEEHKIWYCEMQIPWKAIAAHPPKSGDEFRLNLYRIEGGPKKRKYIVWQQIDNPSYHTPEKFGRLRLTK